MNFIEEKTPKGYLIKIFFDKWQFLAFDRRGKSIYVDREHRSLLHTVPVLVFVGTSFEIARDYEKDYRMLKIRDGVIVVPYVDIRDEMTKYIFLETDKALDAIPARMMHVRDVVQMVREIDIAEHPRYVIVDDAVTPNDVIVIKNRFKAEEIIYSELSNNVFLTERMQIPDVDDIVNLNMMSSNPVYLALIHLRNKDLAKINQLLLDFEINALDTEYILNFIHKSIRVMYDQPGMEKHAPMMNDLLNSFRFYHSLLEKDETAIKKMIDSTTDLKKLTPYRTLVSKVKSMYPGPEEQKLYTVYENILYDRLEELKTASPA
ncbi:MAG: hypothetical protein E4G96_03045 [Chrysiogenales bacterium]|nr:MAG: hypothetical protein E4G96_03045 [Chrysiogenales bacterium]